MTAKITSLTPEQEAMIPVIRDKWIAIGTSCESIDIPKALEAVKLMYECAGIQAPSTQEICFVRSPLEGLVAWAAYQMRHDHPSLELSHCWAWAEKEIINSYETYEASLANLLIRKPDLKPKRNTRKRDVVSPLDELKEAWLGVKPNLKDQIYNFVYGQHEAGWLSFYDYFRDACGLVEETKQLAGLWALAQNTGWCLPYDEVCIVSDRHNILRRDERGRLHNTDNLAVGFPDGWGVYAWHGVRVAKEIITDPITFEQVNGERNAEVKRVMIEKWGEENYIKALGSKPTHVDEFGKFYRVDIGDTEPLCIVQVSDPSTDRRYYIQVAPQDNEGNDMLRARQAVAWTFDKAEFEYAPLVEA